MTRAAELIIQALLPRKPAPVLERKTGLPYGWGLWLRSLPEIKGPLSRQKAEGMVQDLMVRPLPTRGGAIAPALGFWSALRTLFYQQWDKPLREERGMRWLSGAVSLVMHLLFVLLLIWVAVVKLPPPPAEAGDSSRVQVEFIGRGSPEQEGGGAPDAAGAPAPRATASSSAAPAAAAASAADTGDTSEQPTPRELPEFVPPAPMVSAQTPQVQERSVAEPVPPQQPVQVTETPEPVTEYVLTAPTVRSNDIRAPELRQRETSVATREVTVVQAPQVPQATPTPNLAVPQIRQRPVQQVQEREVAAPLPQVRTAQVPSRIAPTRDIPAPAASVREREVPMPNPAAGSASNPAPSASAAAPTSAAPAGATPSTSTGAAPAPSNQTGSGQSSTANTTPAGRGNTPGARAAGPATADRTGGWSTPVRGDDWGASNRNVTGDSGANAGQKPGLFNSDGSVRLPGNSGAGQGESTANRGAPGGEADNWTREKIDKSGTWLQRPPYGYEPTSFDKYWVPNESLLAEWVRRNIREASIPIPGTNKKIKCVISVLQVGGGCGLVDPNLNEQPASARPPPDIPVKRTPIPTDS